MIDKNEKIFRHIKLRIQENFLNTWYTVFQQTCTLIVPMLLLLIYVHRLVSFVSVNETGSSHQLDFRKIYERINEKQSLATSKGEAFNYNLFEDTASLTEVFGEISRKGIFTLEYYEAYFGFMIFWHFFSHLLVTLFSLLYYRKYVDK